MKTRGCSSSMGVAFHYDPAGRCRRTRPSFQSLVGSGADAARRRACDCHPHSNSREAGTTADYAEWRHHSGNRKLPDQSKRLLTALLCAQRLRAHGGSEAGLIIRKLVATPGAAPASNLPCSYPLW
jgi:hypothetical protein